MFYTFSSESDRFGDVVIFVSGPFLQNFCLEGNNCLLLVLFSLKFICDITFKISKLIKRISNITF